MPAANTTNVGFISAYYSILAALHLRLFRKPHLELVARFAVAPEEVRYEHEPVRRLERGKRLVPYRNRRVLERRVGGKNSAIRLAAVVEALGAVDDWTTLLYNHVGSVSCYLVQARNRMPDAGN